MSSSAQQLLVERIRNRYFDLLANSHPQVAVPAGREMVSIQSFARTERGHARELDVLLGAFERVLDLQTIRPVSCMVRDSVFDAVVGIAIGQYVGALAAGPRQLIVDAVTQTKGSRSRAAEIDRALMDARAMFVRRIEKNVDRAAVGIPRGRLEREARSCMKRVIETAIDEFSRIPLRSIEYEARVADLVSDLDKACITNNELWPDEHPRISPAVLMQHARRWFVAAAELETAVDAVLLETGQRRTNDWPGDLVRATAAFDLLLAQVTHGPSPELDL